MAAQQLSGLMQVAPSLHIEASSTSLAHFEIHAALWLAHPRENVSDFFSNARNLEAITPPRVRFEVLNPQPIIMAVGTRIDYRLRVHSIPFRWQSVITEWNPDISFTDEQVRGPYRVWRHRHTFEEAAGGTWVRDHVLYRPIGDQLIQRLFVRRNLKAIFSFRHQALAAHFSKTEFRGVL